MSIITGSQLIDLRKQENSSTYGNGLSQTVINIIEANTGTQVNAPILYTEIDWLNGVPSQIRKYSDSNKTTLIYTITIEWSSGVPEIITTINHDDNITTTTTIYWSNGLPIQIIKE